MVAKVAKQVDNEVEYTKFVGYVTPNRTARIELKKLKSRIVAPILSERGPYVTNDDIARQILHDSEI